MPLANFIVFMMTLGLIVHERNRRMAEGTLYGTIAYYEATRAAEFGLLICVLTAPWLVAAAILLHFF